MTDPLHLLREKIAELHKRADQANDIGNPDWCDGMEEALDGIEDLLPVLEQSLREVRDEAVEECARICDYYKKREYGPHGTEWVSCEDVESVAEEIRALKSAPASGRTQT